VRPVHCASQPGRQRKRHRQPIRHSDHDIADRLGGPKMMLMVMRMCVLSRHIHRVYRAHPQTRVPHISLLRCGSSLAPSCVLNRIPAVYQGASATTYMTSSPTLRWTAITLTFVASSFCARAQDDPGTFTGFNADNSIRGTVTAAGPSTFTIRTDDGDIYKVLYSVNSRIVMDRGPAKPTDIHTGDMLFATGNLDTKARTVGAAVIIGIGAEDVRKAREGLGKTWTAGKITAVDLGDTPKITVARLDGVSQTFIVDESTSFQHHHESITLADIKAGDSLRAEGHLSGKLFLATTVHVFNPGERGGDRQPGAPQR
jgi:hypothetical protein